MPSVLRSGARLIASGSPEDQEKFLADLEDEQVAALPYLFDFWAFDHQFPPKGNWRNWIIMGGRGAGKTRAGAEWVRMMVEGPTPLSPGRARRVALVGDTFDQARDVMVFGESGIMSISPASHGPKWIASRRELKWPNGAEAKLYSAQDPGMLRGPQFDAAWVDELAKWRNGREAWDMLQFCMRLGDHPQICVTTTPRNVPVVRALAENKATAKTHATTFANAANLADGFLEEMQEMYAGTRQGREELDGVLLNDTPGAFWTRDALDACQVSEVPALDRIVVSIDPPAKTTATSDECGIIVAGVRFAERLQDWTAYVLEDATIKAKSPHEWALAAIEAREIYDAQRVVAEVNQGGDMIEEILRTIDPQVPYRGVHASDSKTTRAEPVAALYEQGRVFHRRGLSALEDQMCDMNYAGYVGSGSPDRVDALVWALHELMIKPRYDLRPRIRTLGRS